MARGRACDGVWAGALGLVLAVFAAPAGWGEQLPPLEEYVGSAACGACHAVHYRGWQESYHFGVVQDPREEPAALLGDFSQPGAAVDAEQVAFTIGRHWYQRYAVELEGELYVLPSTWSVASHRWETQDAWSWRKKPYRTFCVGCHAVRYEPATGTMAEHAVGCEACHGPGRAHAVSSGDAAIANPANWSADEQDLLCASCHVRGMDPTGAYHFAVGYVPGGSLTDHYRPQRMQDSETPRQAFLRIFRQWRSRLGAGPPPTCDVCGIEGQGRAPTALTDTDQCLVCHEYGRDFSAHTRHPGNLRLECLDCHRRALDERRIAGTDVHFPDYFRVHGEQTFRLDLAVACTGCHAEIPLRDLNRHLETWDHSNHDRVD